jgi:hypothetical protein
VQREPVCGVSRLQHFDRIVGNHDGLRHVRQGPAVRPPESQYAFRAPMSLEALLVHGPVVSATQHCEVRERGRPALSPVTDVMALPDAHGAAREAAVMVAMVQRSP